MKRVGERDDFKFHPRCTGVKLNHLCFRDDIITCSKGDFKSVLCMLQGFAHFSKTANKQKTEMYTVGVSRAAGSTKIIECVWIQLG